MKKILYNILTWVSGVDLTLLKDCPESENKKYALQGGLILIPTVMALLSMFYASTLLTQVWYIRIILTLIWALIIFVIDRYIVSTFIKNEDGNDWISISFFVRIVFAIGLGVVISHPVIILVFNDKIAETQNEIWLDIKKKTEEEIDNQIVVKSKEYNNRINKLVNDNEILKKVISAELVGANTIIDGYYVSNKVGTGSRINKLAFDTLKNGNELRELKIKTDSIILYYSNKKNDIIAERKKALGKGYWAKDDALELYLTKSKKWGKYYFILIFFIFIDITAVLLKVFTKYGEYDFKFMQRQNNRVQQKVYFLKKLLEKNKLSVDKDYEWSKNKLDKIYEEHKNSNKLELLKSLEESGVLFEEDDITNVKPKLKLPHLLKEVWDLRKIKTFYLLFLISIVCSVAIPLCYFENGIQTSTAYIAIVSFTSQIFTNLIAGLLTHHLTNLKASNNE